MRGLTRTERMLLFGILVLLPLRWFGHQDRVPDPAERAPAVETASAAELRTDALNVLATDSMLRAQAKRCGPDYGDVLADWRARNAAVLRAAGRVIKRGGGLTDRERAVMDNQQGMIYMRLHGDSRAPDFCTAALQMLGRGIWDFEKMPAFGKAAARLKEAAGR